MSTIRYPGGNFVSGYRWEDGVGPRENRPRRLDLAWHSTETNEIGLDEVASWLKKVGCELMYAVNLGTRGVQEALDVLEYANIRSGTTLSDQRIANGAFKPYDIRMWCLGNEMDGPWQLGHGSPEEYGQLAVKTARAMRQLDPTLELVVCGSSNAQMPLFAQWERVVLEEAYDEVDYISCHAYYEPHDGDYASFLASAVNMDRFIDSIVATADHVKAVRDSDKTINISFDEWNVWYQEEEPSKNPEGIGNWPVAPRLLEDVYSLADAVVVGDLLITLLQNADRVHAASLAQLVNVIAPIMTEPNGPAWRQTTFYPFSLTAAWAKGGSVLEPKIESPQYHTDRYGDVASTNAVAVRGADGSVSVFVTNRSLDDECTFDIKLPEGFTPHEIEARTLHDDDILAANTLHDQNRVEPYTNDSASVHDGGVSVVLPPVSWTAIYMR